MEKIYYFLSGLPRTGTTVLGAILNQNPQVFVGPISPLVDFIEINHLQFKTNTSYLTNKKINFENEFVKNIPNIWYADIDKKIIIDKNRNWARHIEYIKKYITSDVKIICTVRPVLEILASFIKIIRQTPNKKSFVDIELYLNKKPITDDNRCDYLMSKHGVVERCLYSLAQPYINDNENLIHIVDYNDLTTTPKLTIDKIYDFLDLPKFEHDFDNITHAYKEDDEVFGIPDLHTVRKSLSKNEYDYKEFLSDYVIEKYNNLEFWN